MKIYIADYFNDELITQLLAVGEVAQNLAEAEIVVVRSKTKCRGDWFGGPPIAV